MLQSSEHQNDQTQEQFLPSGNPSHKHLILNTIYCLREETVPVSGRSGAQSSVASTRTVQRGSDGAVSQFAYLYYAIKVSTLYMKKKTYF